MDSDDAFRRFGRDIESDPLGLLVAKWRRDAFIHALQQLPDVVEVIPTGSLARGTQIGPVHDVDLIVVFDGDRHPDYGSGTESAHAAMTHLQSAILQQMHPWQGDEPGFLKETEVRSHVVTCLGVSTGPFEGLIPSAPPVDVMPAVRHGSHLRVPELRKDASNWLGKAWIDIDPEKFMHLVEQREREWKYFKAVIKLVKAWAEHKGLNVKTMAIEVMVLTYCPRPGLFEALTVSEALAGFFEAAAKAHITSLRDPAGWCGEIDPSMNYGALRRALSEAAGLSRQAVEAERAIAEGHAVDVPDPGSLWRKLFGRKFPRARFRFWPAQQYEPWSATTRASARYPSDFGPFDPGDAKPDGPDNWKPDGPDDRKPNGPDGYLGPDDPDDPDDPDTPSGGVAAAPTDSSPKRPGEYQQGPRPSATGSDPGPSEPYQQSRRGPGARGERPAPASDSRPTDGAEPAEPLAGPWAEVFTGVAAVALTAG